jgi:hypothetical protein
MISLRPTLGCRTKVESSYFEGRLATLMVCSHSLTVVAPALFDMTQRGSQIQLRRQRTMLVGEVRQRTREAWVPLRPILLLQERVGGLQGAAPWPGATA